MAKTKEELIKELDHTIKNYDYWKSLIELNKSCFIQIYYNCIKNKCPKFDILEYRDELFYICNCDWMSYDVGWHVIYFETLDCCIETKKEKS